MENLLGKWGLFPWFIEDGENKIYYQDLDAIKTLSPYCKVFYCEAIENDYICLKYNRKVYRVKSDLFNIINPPKFIFGEEALIKNKHLCGFIEDIGWHYLKQEEFYKLNVNGKIKKTRYFSSELEKI